MVINDTTFFASETNYTIFVDSITLDNVTTTPTSITFFNLTSVGSNFTNTNETFDAVATFIGLNISLTIRNINTSTDLFTSVLGSTDFNATFTTGQVIRIMSGQTPVILCTTTERSVLNITVLFLSLAILLLPIFILFIKGKLSLSADPRMFIIVFVWIIIGLVFIQVIADSVFAFCA